MLLECHQQKIHTVNKSKHTIVKQVENVLQLHASHHHQSSVVALKSVMNNVLHRVMLHSVQIDDDQTITLNVYHNDKWLTLSSFTSHKSFGRDDVHCFMWNGPAIVFYRASTISVYYYHGESGTFKVKTLELPGDHGRLVYSSEKEAVFVVDVTDDDENEKTVAELVSLRMDEHGIQPVLVMQDDHEVLSCIPREHVSVCHCMLLVERAVNSERLQKITILGTSQKQLVVVVDGSITKIQLSEVPQKLDLLDFGLVASYHFSKVLIVHLQNNHLLLLDIFDFKQLALYENITRFVKGDFACVGHDQIVLDLSKNFDLSHYLYIINAVERVSVKKGKIQHTTDASVKSQHLYSVLRALQTRLDESEEQIQIDNQHIDKKKKLISHQEIILDRIMSSDNTTLANDSSTMSLTGIYIPQTSRIQEVDSEQRIHTVPSISHELDRELSQISPDKIKINVISTHQHVSVNEWRVDMILQFSQRVDVTIQCIPFSSNNELRSVATYRWADSTKLSLSLQTTPPNNFANNDTHMHLLLVVKYSDFQGYHYEWLGTLRPTSLQKLLALQKSNLSLVNDSSSILHEYQVLFYFRQGVYNRKSVEAILSEILLTKLNMEMLTSRSTRDKKIYSFKDNGSYMVTLHSLNTENMVCCTIQVTTVQEHLLVLLQMITDQIPASTMVAIPMDIHLAQFSQVLQSMLEEVKNAKQAKNQKSSNTQLETQRTTDYLLGALLSQTPCTKFSYLEVLK